MNPPTQRKSSVPCVCDQINFTCIPDDPTSTLRSHINAWSARIQHTQHQINSDPCSDLSSPSAPPTPSPLPPTHVKSNKIQ